MDLGECSKIHDLALRADYEIASKDRDLFFELDVSHMFVCLSWIGPVFVCMSVCLSVFLPSHWLSDI